MERRRRAEGENPTAGSAVGLVPEQPVPHPDDEKGMS